MSVVGSKNRERRWMKANKDKTLDRLSRLEGQVRGVAKMVETDRYCMDILAQTAAIRSVESGDPEEQRAKFDELIGLLQKASR